jgi:hypothetical protein
MIESGKMERKGHEARVEEIRNAYRILVGKSEGLLATTRRK